MENTVVNNFMRMIAPLGVEIKLDLLAKLSESLKAEYLAKPIDKESLLEELHGSWSNMDDHLEDEILQARSMI